jgi:hypothetical protein
MTILLLIVAVPIPIKGLDEVSGNLIFNGGSSFASSSYVRSGDGSEANPYVISDYAMGSYSIQISNSNEHVVLRNITFTQSSSWAIYLSFTSNVEIINISTDKRNQVVYASSCQDLMILECNFSNIQNSANSFNFLNAVNVTLKDSLFSEDTVTGAGRIRFNNQGSEHIFEGNECDGVPYIDERFSSNGRISKDSPITVKEGNTGAKITDNTMITSTGDALTITSSYRLIISNNYFQGDKGIHFNSLMWQTDATYGHITNNMFESCTYGIFSVFDVQNRFTRYNIRDNYFGNCTSEAIVLNYNYYNNIWRNIFYHNAGTDNTTAGAQASQIGFGNPTYDAKWTIGDIGNFWANHRIPDADNNGITDTDYTIPTNGLDTRPSTNPYFDTTPPSVSITEPLGGTYPRSYIRVKWNAFDDLSGLGNLVLSVDDGPLIDILSKDHHSLFLTSGIHIISIVAHDKAGLYDESNVTVNIPGTEDILTIDHPKKNGYYSETTHQMAWSVKPYFEPVALKLTVDGNESDLLPTARYLTKDFQEGEHTMRVDIVDDDDLTFGKTLNFVIDKTPPEIFVNSPLPNSILSNSLVTFNFSVSDNYRIAKVEARIDNGPYEDVTGLGKITEFLSEGERILNIRAFDKAGLETNITMLFTIGGETGIQIIEPVNGTVTKKTTMEFRWDYEGGFPWHSALLRIDKGAFEDIGGAETKVISLINDGDHVITIRLEDVYGNYLERSTTVIKDTRSPVVDFVYPRDGYVVNQREIQVIWKGTDNLPFPLSGYQLRIDDGSWEYIDNATSIGISLDPGQHTLGLKGIDSAGNIGEKEISIYIDITPPDVVLISPTNGEFLKDTLTEFRWEASDNYELSNLTLLIDHRSRIDVLGRSSYITTIGSDGEHNISLIAMDSAGNIVNITVGVFVDITPPSLNWVMEPIGYLGRDWINISWNATDKVGLANLSLVVNEDQIFLPPNSDNINITLNEGVYRFSLIAVDSVGWEWEIFTSEDLVIDLTPPILELDLERSAVLDRRATLYWTVVESGAGVESTFIDIDGEGYYPVISGGVFTFEDLLPGEHRVTLKVSDRSGNSQEIYWDFIVEKDNGSQGGDGEGGGIPTFGWIAIICVALLVLSMGIGIFFYRKRLKAEERKMTKKPQKIDMGLPSAGAAAALSQRPLNLDLPPASSHKVETTEEGSGYIRPKTEKKKDKKILDIKEDSSPEEVTPQKPDEDIANHPLPKQKVLLLPPRWKMKRTLASLKKALQP